MRPVLQTFLVLALSTALTVLFWYPAGATQGKEKSEVEGGVRLEKVEKKIGKVIEQLEKIEFPDIESPRAIRPTLFISPEGEVRIHGSEVTALSGTSFSVKVWGLTLSVETATTTRFIPEGISFSSLQIGDRVNVKGEMRSLGIVVARSVHDLSGRGRLADVIFNQIRRLIGELRELQSRLGLPLTPLPEAPTSTPPGA